MSSTKKLKKYHTKTVNLPNKNTWQVKCVGDKYFVRRNCSQSTAATSTSSKSTNQIITEVPSSGKM